MRARRSQSHRDECLVPISSHSGSGKKGRTYDIVAKSLARRESSYSIGRHPLSQHKHLPRKTLVSVSSVNRERSNGSGAALAHIDLSTIVTKWTRNPDLIDAFDCQYCSSSLCSQWPAGSASYASTIATRLGGGLWTLPPLSQNIVGWAQRCRAASTREVRPVRQAMILSRPTRTGIVPVIAPFRFAKKSIKNQW